MASALGDLVYAFSATVWKRLAGNTAATNKFLRQVGTGAASAAPSWEQVTDADLSTSNITTNNVTIAKHGFTPILPNDATKYLDGTGAYTVPAGSGGSVTTTGSPASGNLTKFSGAASITNADLTGDVTTSGTVAATIANSAVTLAKIANAAANSKLVGSGSSGSGAAYSEITLGTGLSMSSTTLNASTTSGSEIDYVEFTSPVTVSATTEAGANTVVTGNSISYDGSTIVIIEFYTPASQTSTSSTSQVNYFLFQDGTTLGLIGASQTPAASSLRSSLLVHRRLTPAAGSHVYDIRADRTTANGTVQAGTGGAGNFLPGYIRIFRA